jgi:hypothetical protein
MFETPFKRVATKLHLSGIAVLLDTLNRTARVFARRIFGIGSPDSYKEATATDPRVKVLQDSMLQVVSGAKQSLMQSMDAAEQRIKANASTVAESFYASMEALR